VHGAPFLSDSLNELSTCCFQTLKRALMLRKGKVCGSLKKIVSRLRCLYFKTPRSVSYQGFFCMRLVQLSLHIKQEVIVDVVHPSVDCLTTTWHSHLKRTDTDTDLGILVEPENLIYTVGR
jgi:hypothetical protein